MRKIFITSFLILLSVALISGSAYALSGVCSNCHTMHYSQNGTILSDWGKEGPYGNLLLATCVGCHTGDTPTAKNTHDAPIIYHTTAPSGQGAGETLAGGDFYWVVAGNDALGHNVYDLPGSLPGNHLRSDQNIGGLTPPGWDRLATPGALDDGAINGGTPVWSDQLRCAGKFGCHGNHTDTESNAAILRSHHSNTGLTANLAVDATTVGSSYRFLGGINGLENSEWNWSETASAHNEYYGVNDTSTRGLTYATYNYKRTISYLCAECHGKFHSQIDYNSEAFGSPWARHPTDIVLDRGAGTEYSAYNGGTGNPSTYSLTAPVARGGVPANSSANVYVNQTDEDGAIVMCLSCHRAHGSNQPDLLRWDYNGMVAGTSGPGSSAGTGCFTCHTTKDGP